MKNLVKLIAAILVFGVLMGLIGKSIGTKMEEHKRAKREGFKCGVERGAREGYVKEKEFNDKYGDGFAWIITREDGTTYEERGFNITEQEYVDYYVTVCMEEYNKPEPSWLDLQLGLLDWYRK